MNPLSYLEQACQDGELRPLDLHIGRMLARMAPDHGEILQLTGTLLSAATAQGHTCLVLDRPDQFPIPLPPSLLPDTEQWRSRLLASGLAANPGHVAPLILDGGNRVYSYRFFQIENRIAHNLLQRSRIQTPVSGQPAATLLHTLFGSDPASSRQRLAAALALLKPLLVISGGPGTGKTHTVARILALLKECNTRPLVSALAAPTGKAAARLEESLRHAALQLPASLRHHLDLNAQTLHRLLGYQPRQGGFRYGPDHPLHLDLLVVDEASMVDLVLMDRLLSALRPDTRLILLGDRNQLASVEAGRLFADLCGPGENGWSDAVGRALKQLTDLESARGSGASPSPLTDCIIHLQTSYRFSSDSGIAALARAVNQGQPQAFFATDQQYPDLELCLHAGESRRNWLRQRIRTGFQPLVNANSPRKAMAALDRFRVLCAVRQGPDGVEGINRLAEEILDNRHAGTRTVWYPGRPLIITRNSYDMQLFNGDTGVVWPDATGRLRAWFPDQDNRLRPVSPARLPDHDTAYAITIHKAQGSEFDQVLLLLPERESRVLGRELLYTGITRARKKLAFCATPDGINRAVTARIVRFSGLGERLWSDMDIDDEND